LKYYLSGAITHQPDFKTYFKTAETQLRFLGVDRIFNPADVDLHIPYTEDTKHTIWKQYMKYDLKMLVDADVLILLPGWWRSRGARLELIVCFFLDIRVVTLKRLIGELKNGNS
jgi:hypothetical protein